MTDLTVPQAWRKSSFCDNSSGNCVEFKRVGGGVALRDTTDPAGAILTIPKTAWAAFVAGVRNGEFDV
jgi:hypothetical protein